MNIVEQVAAFWDTPNPKRAHWKEHWAKWDQWGKRHRDMLAKLGDEPKVVLEWGVGGGANAAAMPGARFYGVDISHPTLMRACGDCRNIIPVLVQPDEPEAVIHLVPPVDAFLCTTVIQHMHSKAIVERMLRVGLLLTKSGGSGLIQVRHEAKRAPEDTRYEKHWAAWITYDPIDFKRILERIGWHIEFQESHRPDYHYFGLKRR